MHKHVNLIWLRNDLRLLDNPALYVGSEQECLLLFTGEGIDLDHLGAASRVFLHHALKAFSEQLFQQFKARLIIRPGGLDEVLDQLTPYCQVDKVFWNRSYEPRMIARDLELEVRLKNRGIQPGICRGSVLHEPWEIKNKSALPFRVFTPYYRHVQSLPRPLAPLPLPAHIHTLAIEGFEHGQVEDLKLLPAKPRWDLPMMEHWEASEAGAHALLKSFFKSGVQAYPERRDIPSEVGTSRLAPYLHFGQITPRSIWETCKKHPSAGSEAFFRQIIWREFAIYSLFHQPNMDTKPILAQFEKFPWLEDPQHLKAWQQGLTGYPIVDAGMRELWHTGWMHNRVRMIVGSFLVKNLHLHWLRGAEWFWDTLVDADLANNSMGWQWVSGCGIDPSPYFRIFNPMLQGEKFDPEGLYIKRWIPELGGLPLAHLQKPWEAPPLVLKQAGITLGETYPKPLVDFGQSRQMALMFYDKIKSQPVAVPAP